jgi:hypothetical protein
MPAAHRRGGQGLTVLAALAGILAAIALLVGGAALYADHQKDDGWFTTDRGRFTTDTRALATANLDMDLGGLGALVQDGRAGHARLRAAAVDGGELFVGIARTKDVERYLAGTAHATLTDLETSPFRADIDPVAGDRVPAAPASQDIWAASASGSGTQSMEWEIDEGDWSAVVMNADGSPGVDVRASAGADASFLQPLGLGLLGAALVFSMLCAAAVARTVHDPR